MTHSAALPFTLQRSEGVVSPSGFSSTTETIHGLLRLDGERLLIQWRTARETSQVGVEIRSEHELDPVREIELPLSALASAKVRWSWRPWPPGPVLVLTAADLRAFEQVAGDGGLKLEHPAEFVLRLRRDARIAAQEFAGELEMALADRALHAAERRELLGGASDTDGNR